ncbi:hypothetical protein K1T71_010453 [Dendrolimus kikuchii]|uniref:Uncharacterized protein n=1 Tax=Dendrolimus kikuchii TaxID=765133 RepID=A0ACC1CSP9_9NEOP|nr:hypothetical protein K1T71_010453 [Dendrolimus kikuchii]
MKLIILILHFLSFSTAKDITTIKFIKSFIVNDNKPSTLVFSLCWTKSIQVSLVKEMSEMGIKASSSKYLESTENFQEHTVLFLIDLECPNAAEVLVMAASKQLFRLGYRWLVLTNDIDDEEKNISTLYNSPVLADSDLVLAKRSGNQFVVVELYKPGLNFTMQTYMRGYFDNTLIDVRPHRELFKRRRNLLGYGITMANVIQDSNSTKYHLPLEDRQELQYDAVSKVCWVYAKLAFEMLNATPKYIYSYRWGYQVNGNWSGMIYDVHAKKADLGTNCIIFRDRLDMVTFADKVAPLRMRFVFRQPPLSYASNIFYMPFSTNVWLGIGVCAAVCTVTLYLTSKWEVKIEKNPCQLDGSIGDALLLTMSAVTQQGCFIEPRRAPVLYVTTLCTIKKEKIIILLSEINYYFKENLWFLGQFHSASPGGLFAFHSVVEPVYRRIQDTFQENEKCDLSEVDFLNNFDAFTPMRKDSPYLELIRVVYKQIREAGFKHILNERFQATKPRCLTRILSFTSVGLMDTRPVLIMMLYGIMLSVIIGVLEIIVHKM